MGSEFAEPRPKSPERLIIKSIDSVRFEDGDSRPYITATFIYEPWCCSSAHELIDSVVALNTAITIAERVVREEREESLSLEYSELREQIKKESSGP